MKRFKWPLQRLLDVTTRREEALRSELVSLSQAAARLAQEIVTRQALLRSALQDLGGQVLADRIARHEMVMTCSQVLDREIEAFAHRLDQCRQRRKQRTRDLLKLRASRETLERLRQEARQRYLRQQTALEQRRLDEAAQVAYARNALDVRNQHGKRESADE